MFILFRLWATQVENEVILWVCFWLQHCRKEDEDRQLGVEAFEMMYTRKLQLCKCRWRADALQNKHLVYIWFCRHRLRRCKWIAASLCLVSWMVIDVGRCRDKYQGMRGNEVGESQNELSLWRAEGGGGIDTEFRSNNIWIIKTCFAPKCNYF